MIFNILCQHYINIIENKFGIIFPKSYKYYCGWNENKKEKIIQMKFGIFFCDYEYNKYWIIGEEIYMDYVEKHISNIWIKYGEIYKKNISIKINIMFENSGRKYTNGIQLLCKRYAKEMQGICELKVR
jgi:hypothetical protein